MGNKQNGFAKSALVIVGLFVVFALILTGLNGYTAPIIESNGSAQQFAPLFSVMPEAENFEQLYSSEDSAASALADVPETVQGVYKETSGLGYVVRLATTQGYTGDAIVLTFAVDAEGKISAIELNEYPETKDFGNEEYPQTYVGQDSTLAEVSLVAGVTYSSAAFKGAVNDGFTALINNELIGAGVKSDDQVLMELVAQVFPGSANAAGILQVEESEGSGAIQSVMKSLNGAGFAFIMKDGDVSLLAVCNAAGSCRLYDTEGNDVTDNAAYSSLLEEAVAYTAGNAESFAESEMKKLCNLVSETAEASPLSLNGVFNSVTGAYEITDGDATYYGLVSRAYGYSNIPMEVFFVFDADGAILAMNVTEIIFHPEYFSDYTLDESSYKEGFKGLTADTWTGDQALISGATASTEGVKSATNDIFEAFEIVKVNGGEQ